MERYAYEDRRPRPYRSRSGMVAGVCKGLAEHFGFSVFWTRVVVVAVAGLTTCWPVILAYVVLALLLRPEPRYMIEERVTVSPSARAYRRFESLDKRLRRLEGRVTSKQYTWDERLERGC